MTHPRAAARSPDETTSNTGNENTNAATRPREPANRHATEAVLNNLKLRDDDRKAATNARQTRQTAFASTEISRAYVKT